MCVIAAAAWIVIISIIILAGLFLIQQFGTHFIGMLFSPVIILWFAFNTVRPCTHARVSDSYEVFTPCDDEL